MAESNRVGSRLMSFILLFDCQEAFHCCLVVACSNRINMINIQCHRVGEWSAGKPECGNCIVPVWGNHDYAGLNEVAIPFNWGLTPQQQPGSYQGGELMMMKSVFWWRKPEYPEETTDLWQVTDETFHTYGLCPVRGLNLDSELGPQQCEAK